MLRPAWCARREDPAIVADVVVRRVSEKAVVVDGETKLVVYESDRHSEAINYARQYVVAKHGGGRIVLMGTFYLELSIGDLINIELIGIRSKLVLSFDGHAIYGKARNTKILNIELDGQGRSYRAMYFTEARNVEIKNCYVHGFNDASIFMIGTVKNVEVRSCRIESSGGVVLAFDGDGVSIVGNRFENLVGSIYYKDGIMLFKGKDIEVRSNRFVNMPNRGITAVPSTSTDVLEKVRIVGNYFETVGETAIYVGYRGILRDVTISRNQIKNAYRGIECIGANEFEGLIVSENQIDTTTGAGGIWCEIPDAIVTKNIVRKTWTYGIAVTTKVKVLDNVVEEPDRSGTGASHQAAIVLQGTSNEVRGNRIVNALYGIAEVGSADSNIIENNTMENVTNKYVKVGASTYIDEYVYDKTNLPASFPVKNKPIVALDSGSGTYYSCIYIDGAGWRCVALS